jgi:ABC-2 type transport system permease protein
MMNRSIVMLIARNFLKNTFQSNAIYGVLMAMLLMMGYAAYSGWKTYTVQNDMRELYQQKARASWENNPDKHPHRMAHFGSFAFRIKHPLSFFDFGLESFTGNAVFLEAHKQNTVNFSEASFSTGLLRFGEISMAMLLQVILPLVIVFLGFSAVSADRENGTLKIMLTQGGGSIGLAGIALMIFGLVMLTTFAFLFFSDSLVEVEVIARYTGLLLTYFVFIAVVCVCTVVVSATSSSSKNALMTLLAVWLLLAVVLPRTTQALGTYFFPAPSKIEFETAIEEDILKEGDSHNPDDPHYKHLKDSVLQVHQVDAVEKLPFNYSGFVMRESEKISANIYNKHLKELVRIYDRQNSLSKASGFINPIAAVRNISMAVSQTDFEAYKMFQDESEAYRYQLAQKMNELQMELISNKKLDPNEKPYSIDRHHWKELPDFRPSRNTITSSLKNEVSSFISLVCWCVGSWWIIGRISKTLKAI